MLRTLASFCGQDFASHTAVVHLLVLLHKRKYGLLGPALLCDSIAASQLDCAPLRSRVFQSQPHMLCSSWRILRRSIARSGSARKFCSSSRFPRHSARSQASGRSGHALLWKTMVPLWPLLRQHRGSMVTSMKTSRMRMPRKMSASLLQYALPAPHCVQCAVLQKFRRAQEAACPGPCRCHALSPVHCIACVCGHDHCVLWLTLNSEESRRNVCRCVRGC